MDSTECYYALTQAKKISSCLMPYLPNVVANNSPDLVFRLEDVRSLAQIETLSALLEIHTGFDPLTNKIEMKYSTSPDGQSVPMKIIVSGNARIVYERMMDIIESSDYPLYNPVSKNGFWIRFVIQVNHIGEVLLVVEGYVTDKENANDTMSSVCLYLENSLHYDTSNCPVTSLIMRIKHKNEYSTRTLMGQGFIREMIADFEINVYGKYHSLVNPYAVKEISGAIKDVAQLDKSWNILQLGIGYDAVTFFLSQVCKKICILSNDSESSLHTFYNATLNGVQNVIFHSGSVLEQLENVLNNEPTCNKVCMLIWEFCNEISDSDEDVKVLREHTSVEKIVLISDIFVESNVSKLLTLCQNRSCDQDPFVITKAIPVEVQPNDVKIVYLFLRKSLVLTPLKVYNLTLEENECKSPKKAEKVFSYEKELGTNSMCQILSSSDETVITQSPKIKVNENTVKDYLRESSISNVSSCESLYSVKKPSELLHDVEVVFSTHVRGDKRKYKEDSCIQKHNGKIHVAENSKKIVIENIKEKDGNDSDVSIIGSKNTSNTVLENSSNHNDIHAKTEGILHTKSEHDENKTIEGTYQEHGNILHEWRTDLDIENDFHIQVSRTVCDTQVKTLQEYEEQLKLKQMWVLSQAKTISNILEPILPVIVKNPTPELVFHMEIIRACPLTKSVSDRFQVVSGSNAGTDRLSMEYCLNTHSLSIPRRHFNSDVIMHIYEYLMEFISESKLPLFNPVSKDGFWKKMVIRINNVKESMVIVQGHVKSRKEANVIFPTLAEELEAYFKCTKASSFKPVSLILKIEYGSSRAKQKVLFGHDFLNDIMGDFKVKIFDDLFLYSNPFGAEALSQAIVDLADINNSWFILQIGYGDCITSLSLAKKCRIMFILDDDSSLLGLHLLSNAQNNSISNIYLVQPKDGRNRINSLLNNKLKYLKRICVVINNFSFLSDHEVSTFHTFPKVKKIVCLSDFRSYLELKTVFTLCGKTCDGKDLFVVTNATSVDLSPYEGSVKVAYLLERKSLQEGCIERNRYFSKNKVSEFENINNFENRGEIYPEISQKKCEKMLTISRINRSLILAQNIKRPGENATEETTPQIVIKNVMSLRENMYDKVSHQSASCVTKNRSNILINDDFTQNGLCNNTRSYCDNNIRILSALNDGVKESESSHKSKNLNVKNGSVQTLVISVDLTQNLGTVNELCSVSVNNNNIVQNVQTCLEKTQLHIEKESSNIVDNVSRENGFCLPDVYMEQQSIYSHNKSKISTVEDNDSVKLLVYNKETEVIDLEDNDSSNEVLNFHNERSMINTDLANKTRIEEQIHNYQNRNVNIAAEVGSENSESKEKPIDILKKGIKYLYDYYSKRPAEGLAVIENIKKQNPNLSLNPDLQKFVKEIDVDGVNFTSLSTIGKSFIEVGLLLSEKNVEDCDTKARSTLCENKESENNVSPKLQSDYKFEQRRNSKHRKRQCPNLGEDKPKKRKKVSHNEPVVISKAHSIDHNRLALHSAKLLSSELLHASSSLPDTRGLVFVLDNLKKSDITQTSCEKLQVFSGVSVGSNTPKLAYDAHINGSLVDLSNVHSTTIKLIYGKMLSFIIGSSYKVYNPEKKTGFWKSMIILVNECGEAMVTITGHIGTKKNTVSVKKISELAVVLKKYSEEKIINSSTVLASFVLKTCYTDKTHVKTVLGEDFLIYNQNKLKIKIFPESLLSNPFEVEMLSDTILEVAEINNGWGVLQMCCKYDLPSLKLAMECKKMIVLDKHDNVGGNLVDNAKLNNINNLRYIPGSKCQLSWNVLKKELNNCKKICVFIYRLYNLTDYSCRRLLCDVRIKKIIYTSGSFNSAEAKKVVYLCDKERSVSKDPFVVVKGIPFVIPSQENKVEMLYLLVRESLNSDSVSTSSLCNTMRKGTKTIDSKKSINKASVDSSDLALVTSSVQTDSDCHLQNSDRPKSNEADDKISEFLKPVANLKIITANLSKPTLHKTSILSEPVLHKTPILSESTLHKTPFCQSLHYTKLPFCRSLHYTKLPFCWSLHYRKPPFCQNPHCINIKV